MSLSSVTERERQKLSTLFAGSKREMHTKYGFHFRHRFFLLLFFSFMQNGMNLYDDV